ncbi:MAG: hypothetical protein P4L99_29950 [Chthoniobacter sp.]|nr:hypothetical protein [Chthoniobacter sp.]
MKDHWHEQIQRYVNGQASTEEADALQAALIDDAELRALYLDYMNLDVALSAAAELAAIGESGAGRMTHFPPAPPPSSLRYGRRLAALAACVTLALLVVLPKHRQAAPARPDIAAAISSTQSAIARLSVEPASPFPSWMSPTGSLLDQP